MVKIEGKEKSGINRLINKMCGNTIISELPSASSAFGLTKYGKSDKITLESIKESLIKQIDESIMRRVLNENSRYENEEDRYVFTKVFSNYREKLVLPGVKEYYQDKGYSVELLNDDRFLEYNVIVITWQGYDPELITEEKEKEEQ